MDAEQTAKKNPVIAPMPGHIDAKPRVRVLTYSAALVDEFSSPFSELKMNSKKNNICLAGKKGITLVLGA